MQTMLWPDEIRAAEFDVLDDVPEPKDAEKAMATMLVDSMAGDFDPSEYEDDYAGAVEALVKSKLEGGDAVAAPVVEEEGGEVVDLLAALQASVERAKKARGGAAEESDADSGDDATAKKAAPAKEAATKTTAKTTAKKTTAKASTKESKDDKDAKDERKAG